MNLNPKLFLQRKKKVVPRQVLSSDWEDRCYILEPDVNLVCWQRLVNKDLRTAVNEMMVSPLPPLRLNVNIDSLETQLTAAAFEWHVTKETQPFWQDVLRLTGDFLGYSSDRRGVLHIRVVDSDACTKFHVDGYRIRLFTTYYGPGTEWLPEDVVNRRALGGTNDLIVRHNDRVRSLSTFHVGILKGEIPGKRTSVPGIVHRSPNIIQKGLRRLILRIDIN